MITVHEVPQAHLDQVFDLNDIVFHEHTDEDERGRRRWLLERAWRIGAYENGRLVGFMAVLPMRMSVPGGSLPCSGVTYVMVLPTHRRRGVLTALMDRLWRDGQAPLAGLYVSEASIYGRFGFQPANHAIHLEIDSDWPLDLRIQPDPRALRLVETSEVPKMLAPIYERAASRRPGQFHRDEQWWTQQILPDADENDEALTAPRVVVIDDAGYAIYRTKPEDESSGTPGLVQVVELEADTVAVEAALWRYLASIDLTWRVRSLARPVDDPAPLIAADLDAVRVTRTWPALWLRLTDVAKALEGRSWAGQVDLTLRIIDTRLPANDGTWHLRGTADEVSCQSTRNDPDLTLDVGELAAVYLGGTSVASLVRAGLVHEHSSGAAHHFDQALKVPLAPFSADEF